jgi:hypothetical protein
LILKVNWRYNKPGFLFLSFLFCVVGGLSAVEEYSASANALSGITLLSDSVADYSLSPIMQISGLSTFYNRPFNSSTVSILGLHNAIKRNQLFAAVGTSYLHHEDYVKHNPYLNVHYRWRGISFGATGHLFYDTVGSDDAQTDFSYDLGAGFAHDGYAAELKLLRAGLDSEQLCFDIKGRLSPELDAALSYVDESHHEDYLRVGLKLKLHEIITLYGSWQNEPNHFGMGLRVNPGSWSLMYSIRTHTALDPTHAISLDIPW